MSVGQTSSKASKPQDASPRQPGVPVSGWEAVIGLEVHCELLTETKLFCGCRNRFGDEPNTSVCPVCLGLPGSLPVLNSRAVELAMRIGTALQCEIRPSVFHRKNYFYPDMPKDYQISQYDEPINVNGRLDLPDGTSVGITRAHLEEDTGKTTHVGESGRISGAEYSLVDYNRAGVPLVEIVSEPDIRSGQQARMYVSELRAVLVASGATDGRMEEGSLRVDANVSVRRSGVQDLGTRCEVKNLNSLRSLAKAVDFEIARQVALIESGGVVAQETRHWNESASKTMPLRSKEEAFDYRYFPEPDLVPIIPGDQWQAEAIAGMGPMPARRRERLVDALGEEAAGAAAFGSGLHDQVVTVVELGLDTLVLDAVQLGADPRLSLSRAANEVAANLEGVARLSVDSFERLISLEAKGKLSATQAKAVLSEMLAKGGDPTDIAKARGFEVLASSELAGVVAGVVNSHPKEWSRFVDGDEKIVQFFVGQVMKETRGKADGKAVLAELNRLRDSSKASGD
ncbi:MAG: Asp-tRNA(Asn)/Glu-tRNA(Gln) amidotransferase subunit GatB [Acidimicrobiales bacterium]